MIDFPITDILEETAQSFASLAVTQGKTFTVQIQPMLSYYGDVKTIHRLAVILLDNALKYSDEKGNITISLEKADRALRLAVHNTFLNGFIAAINPGTLRPEATESVCLLQKPL